MAYSLDLRHKAISSYESDEGTQNEIANVFGVSLSTFKRWLVRKKSGENLKPRIGNKGRPKKINNAGFKTLKTIVEINPSITLAELSDLYLKEHKIRVGTSVLSRALSKLNLRYKKLSIKAVEKESDEVKKKERSI